MRNPWKQNLGRTVAAVACLFLVALPGSAAEAELDVTLAIPECKLVLSATDRAELPKKQISTLILQVRPRTGAVRYGSIRVLLNGESMSREMTVKGVEGGYDCLIESVKGSSLPLHAGDNLVETSITDTWNHVHEVKFTVVVPDSPK